MMSEITSPEDLLGMLDSEVFAEVQRLTAALADMTAERDWERRQKLDLVAVGQAFVDEINRLFSERNASTAALAASEARVATIGRTLHACRGIIHEGLHGGRATVPEHQELCQRPACRWIRAVLAGTAVPGTGDQEQGD